jgi:hypothetical protein
MTSMTPVKQLGEAAVEMSKRRGNRDIHSFRPPNQVPHKPGAAPRSSWRR